MDSLYDLLANKNFDEPTEIAAIKDYARQMYNAEVQVSVKNKNIVVVVPSASLASRLLFDLPKLKRELKTDKTIVLRIGSKA